MTKIISLLNEKGGVGKTTLALALADLFSRKGKKVLIIDCDPQKSLSAWVRDSNVEFKFETMTLLDEKQQAKREANRKDVEIVKKNVEFSPDWQDIVILDTPGFWKSKVIEGVREYSDFIILPTQINRLSLDVTLINAYELANPPSSEISQRPKSYKILFNNIDPRSMDEAEAKKKELLNDGYNVFDTTVRRFAAIEHLNNSSLFEAQSRNTNPSRNDILELAKETYQSLYPKKEKVNV